MSAIHQLRCDTCEADGPKLRRGMSRTTLCTEVVTGPFDEAYLDAAAVEWNGFLIRHEGHDLRLKLGP